MPQRASRGQATIIKMPCNLKSCNFGNVWAPTENLITLHLIASASERAVECLLTFILWSKAAQEHVVLTRHVCDHKKAMECSSRVHQRHWIVLMIFTVLWSAS